MKRPALRKAMEDPALKFNIYSELEMMELAPFRVEAGMGHTYSNKYRRKDTTQLVRLYYLRDRNGMTHRTHSARAAMDRVCELLNLAYAEHCMLEGS